MVFGDEGPAAAPRARACRSASSKCRRGREAAARRGGRRRSAGDGWQRRGGARAARSSPARMPAAAASSLRSRAKAWRVRWPLSPNEGNSHGLRPHRRPLARREIGRDRRPRLVGERHDPLVPALAADGEEARLAPDHRCRQRHQLGDAQAGRVEELDQRVEPPRPRARQRGQARRAPAAARAVSISRSTSASLSTIGRRAGCRGPSTVPVGSSPRTPSPNRNWWNCRIAESRRATERAAKPRSSRSTR